MVNYERKITRQAVDSIGYDLDGLTFDEAIEFFQKKKSYYEGHECELDWDYVERRLSIVTLATETDESYKIRIAREEARQPGKERS